MKILKYIGSFLAVFQMICPSYISAYAMELSSQNANQPLYSYDEVVNSNIGYLVNMQAEDGTWGKYGKLQTAKIANMLEYFYGIQQYKDYDNIINTIDSATDYFYIESALNVDEISQYLLFNALHDERYINYLLECQNFDGGFGLTEGYTSDIIDTKLALKALTDLGETEAMTNAALYISSLQNEDGGFGYQQGLSSNAYLSAEIADILVDTVDVNPVLSYYLEDTFTTLDSYLDTTFPALNELSASDLDTVYQHFYTALYRLKRDGRYDVTPYYALQSEVGGMFDDPMATALFLELLVREQNALVAKIDNIAITNDKGYAVSAFNSNENVNISVINEFETDKAHFEMSIMRKECFYEKNYLLINYKVWWYDCSFCCCCYLFIR